MKFIVNDSVNGETLEIEAKTPKRALIKFLKQDCVEGNPNMECVWDITVNRKFPRTSSSYSCEYSPG